MIKAFGKTYETIDAALARIEEIEEVSAQYGDSDDRVTEVNAILAAIAEARREEAPAESPIQQWERDMYVDAPVEYHVEKNEYELECDHPACPVMHAHLDNGRYDKPVWETYHDMKTDEEKRVLKSTYHLKQRVEWVLVDQHGNRATDGWLSDAWSTKREATAVLEDHKRRQQR